MTMDMTIAATIGRGGQRVATVATTVGQPHQTPLHPTYTEARWVAAISGLAACGRTVRVPKIENRKRDGDPIPTRQRWDPQIEIDIEMGPIASSYMNFLRLNAATSSAVRVNHSPLARWSRNR